MEQRESPKRIHDQNSKIIYLLTALLLRYSGVAWATKSEFENNQVNIITTWPGTGREEGKAPTELCYDDDSQRPTWGYDIQPDGDPVRWFKLLILKTEDMAPEARDSEFLIRGRRMMKDSGKSAIDFIADYLRALWAHILDMINKARGEAVIDAMTFHVVITVPAIWKSYARQYMEEAARKAGILDLRTAGPTKLTLAPEPEAAALSTLCEQGGRVKPGDVYVICDAGGGTVVSNLRVFSYFTILLITLKGPHQLRNKANDSKHHA